MTSVSWAPSCGRSFHLIATGSRDGKVRIWKIRPSLPLEDQDPMNDSAEERWSAALVADFDDHGYAQFHKCGSFTHFRFLRSVVGRVEWNITG